MPAGQRIPFFYEFVIDYKARGGGRVDAFIAADFSGSIHWGGIERVVNATTGEVLQDWTIESESGFDYSRSFEAQVPEPTSMLLLTTSLFALVGLHRWR